MTKIVNCDCGRVLRGDTDDELVAAAQKHAREAHGMELTREQVLTAPSDASPTRCPSTREDCPG